MMGLLYLLWRYVPAQAARLEELGAPLPLATRYVLAASNWFVRLLPFLVVLGFGAGPVAVALIVAAFLRGPFYRVLKVVGIVLLLVGAVEAGACAFIVYGMQPRPRPAAPRSDDS
jgi:type II secretory pathway component PulF